MGGGGRALQHIPCCCCLWLLLFDLLPAKPGRSGQVAAKLWRVECCGMPERSGAAACWPQPMLLGRGGPGRATMPSLLLSLARPWERAGRQQCVGWLLAVAGPACWCPRQGGSSTSQPTWLRREEGGLGLQLRITGGFVPVGEGLSMHKVSQTFFFHPSGHWGSPSLCKWQSRAHPWVWRWRLLCTTLPGACFSLSLPLKPLWLAAAGQSPQEAAGEGLLLREGHPACE